MVAVVVLVVAVVDVVVVVFVVVVVVVDVVWFVVRAHNFRLFKGGVIGAFKEHWRHETLLHWASLSRSFFFLQEKTREKCT